MIEIQAGISPGMALEIVPAPFQDSLTPMSALAVYNFGRLGPAWAVKREGKVVAIAGHMPQWDGRTIAWASLGAHCGPALTAMIRHFHREVSALAYDRVEAYVACNHEAGHKFIKMLGFRREGTMRKFAHGRDYTLYAKVR